MPLPPGEPSPSPVIPIPIESTQEFQVATTNPNSTFARSSGGQVAMLTKAGTNEWHGSLYEYHNDDALNANGWTNDHLGLAKAHSADNRFGGTVGGPIWKNKLFFFANYEGRRLHDDYVFNTIVPTASLKQGILQFPDATGAVRQYSLQPGSITTACGGASCDPRNIGMSPVIKSELGLYPAGNNPSLGDGLNTIGYTFDAPTPIGQNLGVVRFDYVISKKWSAFMTYPLRGHCAASAPSSSASTTTSAPGSVAQDPIKASFYTFEFVGQLSPTPDLGHSRLVLARLVGMEPRSPTPLVSGTTAALEMAGEGAGTSNSTTKLFADPVLLATSNARSRVFDGHKWYLAQDFSLGKGQPPFPIRRLRIHFARLLPEDRQLRRRPHDRPDQLYRVDGKRQRRVRNRWLRTRTGDLRWRPNDKLSDLGKPASLQRTLLNGFGIGRSQFASLDSKRPVPAESPRHSGILAHPHPGRECLFPGYLEE